MLSGKKGTVELALHIHVFPIYGLHLRLKIFEKKKPWMITDFILYMLSTEKIDCIVFPKQHSITSSYTAFKLC